MVFIIVAVVAGLIAGFLRGGRIAGIGEVAFRWWPMLLAGVVLQGFAGLPGPSTGLALLLGSYVLILAFTAANLRLAGMGLVALGVAMNFATIAVNDGMPVEDRAIVAAGITDWEGIDDLEFGAKRHLAGPDDELMWLSDVIPVPVAEEVLSFGDLVMSVGVAVLLSHVMARSRVAPRR